MHLFQLKWTTRGTMITIKITMIPITIHNLIFISFHHICFLTLLAPLLKPWALTAKLSALSWIESNLSPLSATLLRLSLMISTVSLTCCCISSVLEGACVDDAFGTNGSYGTEDDIFSFSTVYWFKLILISNWNFANFNTPIAPGRLWISLRSNWFRVWFLTGFYVFLFFLDIFASLVAEGRCFRVGRARLGDLESGEVWKGEGEED